MAHNGPFLIEFKVEPEENVFPMVPPGASVAEFIEAPKKEVSTWPATKHSLVAIVQDKPGVLNRMVSLFRRRGFNIESIAVGHSEVPHLSRVSITVNGTVGHRGAGPQAAR